MKNIPKLIPVAYFKAYKDDGTLVWGEDCVSATNDFEEADYTGVALVRLSDVAALSEVECENCNQLVRALREAVEGPTFMGEPVFTPPSGAAVKEEPTLTLRHATLALQAMRLAAANGNFGDPVYSTAYIDGSIEDLALYATPQPPTAEPGQPSGAVRVDENDIAAIEWIEAHGADSSDGATLTLYKHRWKAIGKVLRQHGLPFGTIASPKPSEQARAADVAVPECGIKAGETLLQAAEGWAQWCEVRGNQMLANFLRTATQPPASPVAVPEATQEQIEALDDLVTLVRRLVNALHKAAPDNDLTNHAVDYLQRKGFNKGPFRSATQTPPQPLADSRGSDEVGV